MNSNRKLLELIKKAAGTFHNEGFKTFIGEIKSVDSDNLTCEVESITGTTVYGEVFDPNNQLGQDQSANYSEFVKKGIVYPNVALMAGGSVDDGFIIYPSIGSHVTFVYNRYQQPYCVQYSKIDKIEISIGDSIYIYDNDGFIVKQKNKVSFSILSGSNVDIGEDIIMKSKNGVTISGDTKLTLKNTSTSLKTILTDLRTQVGSTVTATTALNAATAAAFASGNFPAAATSFAAATGAITAQLTAITAQLTLIQTKIDSLFE